jgi:hypothetical protein
MRLSIFLDYFRIPLLTLLLVNFAPSASSQEIDSGAPKLRSFLGVSQIHTSLEVLSQLGAHSGKTTQQPWSSSYFPDLTGSIAAPYRSQGLLGAQLKIALGREGHPKLMRRHLERWRKHWTLWSHDELNRELSPSAKYDLWVGNSDFEFSSAILSELAFRSLHGRVTNSEGQTIWNSDGNGFPAWNGICDGWAYASIVFPRPVKPVTLVSPSGREITWFPEDIKALGSYLMARTNTEYFSSMGYRFLGGRCKSKRPDARCNDLRPDQWHLTLANRIGIQNMGFVMDIDNNHKINNHPVFSYEFEYFSLRTGQKGDWKKARELTHTLQDRLAQGRHPQTRYIVGVKSKIHYLSFILSEKRKKQTHDDPSQDSVKQITYTYDLELSEDGTVLGGVWGNRRRESDPVAEEDLSNSATDLDYKVKIAAQPDFIWLAPVGFRPYSSAALETDRGDLKPDGSIEWKWNGQGAMPDDWQRAVKFDQRWAPPRLETPGSKLRSAQPLSNLVALLFELSKN